MNSFLPRLRAVVSPLAFAIGALASLTQTFGEVWNLPAGGSYNTADNWTPASIPSGTGASAVFNGAATAANPDQTANRPVTLDGAQTVGSILFNNDFGTFTNTLSTGTGGSLLFDATGAGPATINTTGFGTGNNTISAPMTLTDSLVVTVDNTSATSQAGSLNLTGSMSGPGGFTKSGDGLATFGTGAKTFTGPTVLNGGRMRMSLLARPSMTSSLTINSGAQLVLIAGGNFTFGPGPLNINGSGPTSGPFASFPGAIRPDTNLAITIGNPVVLQSDSLIHVQGAATGSITFSSEVAGPGRLTLTAPASDANLGRLVLAANNLYSGGTTVNGGTLVLSGAAANVGLGEVLINSANLMFAGASAKLTIETGVIDAIANSALLSLAGGNVFGFADDGFAELQDGVNELVGALILGGAPQLPGTYGSTASGATFKSDEYFSGTGVLTVIPEPAAGVILLIGAVSGIGFVRRRTSRT